MRCRSISNLQPHHENTQCRFTRSGCGRKCMRSPELKYVQGAGPNFYHNITLHDVFHKSRFHACMCVRHISSVFIMTHPAYEIGSLDVLRNEDSSSALCSTISRCSTRLLTLSLTRRDSGAQQRHTAQCSHPNALEGPASCES